MAWLSVNPPAYEQFASVSVLDANLGTISYFPGNTSKVQLGQVITWEIQLYNHVGSTQLFLVDVKLSNETIPGPVASTNQPSAGTVVFQATKATLNNETWIFPLQWSVANFTRAGLATITNMQVNNQTSSVNVSAISGRNFRMVVELWTYDVQNHNFLFSFRSGGTVESVWGQLWFDA